MKQAIINDDRNKENIKLFRIGGIIMNDDCESTFGGGYCVYYKKEISSGLCEEIIYQISGMMKKIDISEIQERLNLTIEDMMKICTDCPNSPVPEPFEDC